MTTGGATRHGRDGRADLDGLVADLGRVLGPGVGIGACRYDAAGPLWPEEDAAMARAIPARRAEFAAGRTAARRALMAAGAAATAIGVAPTRAPVWLAGLVGSITHHGVAGDGLALAVVGPRAVCAGLGLDLVDDAPLPPDIAAEIAFGPERALPSQEVFAAKEATWKALSAMLDTVWPFDALSVTLAERGFVATLRRPAGHLPTGHRLTGHLLRADGMLIAAIALAPPDAR